MIDGVIQIQGENPYYFELLEHLAIPDIYVIPQVLHKKAELGEDISEDTILYRYHDILPELMQLEFHLADHCNLNCKGCSHFSNLVAQPVFADREQFTKDLMQLTIVTNGILLLKLKEDLIATLKENRVHISISDYSCLDREKIVAFVKKHALSDDLREGKECFSKYINPKGDTDKNQIFFDCVRRNCTFLDKGKIAACCQPFTVHYFNDYFQENLPENEGIDLYETGLDGWKIQKRLITPMNSCRYCANDVPFEWEPSYAPFSKEDWCI